MANCLRILLMALSCTVLGLLFFHAQDHAQPAMNAWGVIAFGSVGASLGCLTSKSDDDSSPLDFWRHW